MSLEWYLCVINKNFNSPNINTKDCKCVKYNDLRSANFNLNILGNNFKTILIPVCKYTPIMFHKYILNYKLDNSIFFKNIIIKNS
jgi:hypothetical protein